MVGPFSDRRQSVAELEAYYNKESWKHENDGHVERRNLVRR
jgi:hypothetical protein